MYNFIDIVQQATVLGAAAEQAGAVPGDTQTAGTTDDFQVSTHIRRIKTEEKAKVVAVISRTELIQFIAVLAIFHQDDLKKGMYSSYASYRPGAIHPIL